MIRIISFLVIVLMCLSIGCINDDSMLDILNSDSVEVNSVQDCDSVQIASCESFFITYNTSRYYCYQHFAVLNNNPDLCVKIPKKICDNQYYEDSRDICYFEVAVNNNDISVCDKIEDILPKGSSSERWRKPFCKAIVSKDPEYCKILEKYRDSCISDLAYALNDTLICNEIEDPAKRERCLN